MTRLQAVGVLLVALGLIYALLYAAWLRKRRRHASAAIVAERERTRSGEVTDDGKEPKAAAARLSVEGTYVSTTTAVSRLERVTVEGLGNRARATLVINRGTPEDLVRIERQGESTVVITGPRLVAVRRDRGMVGKFVGSNKMLVLQWRADDDALYETGFLPRYKADLDRVESALWWHTGESRESENPAHDPDSPATEGRSTS
ncbi:PH-like domain-containing protein [Pedococcus soli]